MIKKKLFTPESGTQWGIFLGYNNSADIFRLKATSDSMAEYNLSQNKNIYENRLSEVNTLHGINVVRSVFI